MKQGSGQADDSAPPMGLNCLDIFDRAEPDPNVDVAM
jgi:hypothetical protein